MLIASPSAFRTVPSPIAARATWDKGARSPLQPKDPYWRTAGVIPAASMAASVSTTTGRTPVRPEARVRSRSSIIARTTSRGIN